MGRILTLLCTGAQEYGKRSGTENVSGIIGLGKSIELSTQNIDKKCSKIVEIKDEFVQNVIYNIPNAYLNGHPTKKLPGIVNFSFQDINASFLTSELDKNGVCVSSGSACSCKSAKASHVLLAMNKSESIAFSSIRFSLGDDNTKEELKYVVKILSEKIYTIRKNL